MTAELTRTRKGDVMADPLRVRIGVAGSCLLAALSGCQRSERLVGAEPPPPPPASWEGPQGAAKLALGKPAMDLPAHRLSERVNGGEARLRRLGCQRMRIWRLATSSADLELLDFAEPEGASKALVEDAGADRTPELPGDEGWIGPNVLYYRDRARLVRVIADEPRSASALRSLARDVERALGNGSSP